MRLKDVCKSALITMVFFSIAGASVYADESKWRELNKQAVDLFVAGNHDKAVAQMKEAVAYADEYFGTKSIYKAKSLNNLGNFLAQIKRPNQARVYFERALKIEEEVEGSESPVIADTLYNVAMTYVFEGNREKALNFLAASLAIYEKDKEANAKSISRVSDMIQRLQ